MRLDAYNGSTIQSFISLLDQAESEGITDTRDLKNIIENAYSARMVALFKVDQEMKQEIKQEIINACPHCGAAMQTPCAKNQVEGLKRLGCHKCFYSEVVNAS